MPPINISSPHIGPGGLDGPGQSPGIQSPPKTQTPAGAPVLPRSPPHTGGGVNQLRNAQLPPTTAAFTPNVGGFALPNQPRMQAAAPPAAPMTAAFTPNIGGFALPPQPGMQGPAASMNDVLAQMVQQHSQPPPQAMQSFARPAMSPPLERPLPPLPQSSRPFVGAGVARPNLDKPLPPTPQGTPQGRPNFDKPLPPTPQARPQPGLSQANRPNLDKPLPALPQMRPQGGPSSPGRPAMPMQARPSGLSSAPARPSFQAVAQAATASVKMQSQAKPQASSLPQASSQPQVSTPTPESTSAPDVSALIGDASQALDRLKQRLEPSASTLASLQRLEELKSDVSEFSDRQLEALRGELSAHTQLELKTEMWRNESKSANTREEAAELSLARDKMNAELGVSLGDEKLEAAGQRFLAEGAPMHKKLVLDLIEIAEEDAEDSSLPAEVRDERAEFAKKLQNALDVAAQSVKK